MAGKKNQGAFVQLEGHKYVLRELKKRYGDEQGKEFFRLYRAEIKGMVEGTTMKAIREFIPVDTGRLKRTTKIGVTSSKIYIQSGTPSMGKYPYIQYHGLATRKGKYWIWRGWQDTKGELHERLVPMAQKYASMVDRRLNTGKTTWG